LAFVLKKTKLFLRIIFPEKSVSFLGTEFSGKFCVMNCPKIWGAFHRDELPQKKGLSPPSS